MALEVSLFPVDAKTCIWILFLEYKQAVKVKTQQIKRMMEERVVVKLKLVIKVVVNVEVKVLMKVLMKVVMSMVALMMEVLVK